MRGRRHSRQEQYSQPDWELPWGSHHCLLQVSEATGHILQLVPVSWRPAWSQGLCMQDAEPVAYSQVLSLGPLGFRLTLENQAWGSLSLPGLGWVTSLTIAVQDQDSLSAQEGGWLTLLRERRAS